jgi:fumarate reductase flavoprotein subunit
MADPRRDGADLIVVGASVSGLTAAILAADRGCRVVLLERGKELGGGAIHEAEVVAAAPTRLQREAGVDDTADRLAGDILGATHHHVEAEVVRAIAAESGTLVEWLADRAGVPMALIAGHTPPGLTAPCLHFPVEGGAGLVAGLARAAARNSRVSVRTGMAAERLVRGDRGTITGVAVRTGRRVEQVPGTRVLLAGGGFAAVDDLVREHCPAVAALPYLGSAGATGECLRLGIEAGGSTRRMAACHVTPFLAQPGPLVVTEPLALLGAILVNQAGRRFADETAESLTLATAVRAQPGRVGYLIFDDTVVAAGRKIDPFFARVVLPRTSRRAITLADLAKQFEIDAEALTLTIDTYNANLDLGGDPFGRERRGQPLAPPFHAIRVTGARRGTRGGLAVDAAGHVLDAAGQPVAGLYAAGGTAAGLGGEGTEGALPGVDALAALALARLVALAVVTDATAAKSAPPE